MRNLPTATKRKSPLQTRENSVYLQINKIIKRIKRGEDKEILGRMTDISLTKTGYKESRGLRTSLHLR